jgi:hypothetical protein
MKKKWLCADRLNRKEVKLKLDIAHFDQNSEDNFSPPELKKFNVNYHLIKVNILKCFLLFFIGYHGEFNRFY